MSEGSSSAQLPSSGAAPGNGAGGGAGTDDDFAPRAFGLISKATLLGLAVAGVVGVALVIAFFDAVRHWFAIHTGTLHGGPDLYYNFWSGFGADLGEATLVSAVAIGVYTGARKVNCHSKGCWRIGHHALDGTPYILCRHHHPQVPSRGASHEHILEQHLRHVAAKAEEELAHHRPTSVQVTEQAVVLMGAGPRPAGPPEVQRSDPSDPSSPSNP